MGMHYYSFGTALYQRFVGKQTRVVKEILGLGVFHHLQCSGFFFRKSNGRKGKFSKRKLLTFMDRTSTFPQVVNMRYSKQLDSSTLK